MADDLEGTPIVAWMPTDDFDSPGNKPVSYTHLRAHETVLDLVCRLLLEKKKQHRTQYTYRQSADNILTKSIIDNLT